MIQVPQTTGDIRFFFTNGSQRKRVGHKRKQTSNTDFLIWINKTIWVALGKFATSFLKNASEEVFKSEVKSSQVYL